LNTPSTESSQPLVSIITIVYNGEKHLEQTIQSVLGQTYPHIEYIIIDGGSTDSSVSIIKKYAPQLARWISEPDKGISDAFNKGIAMCNGDLIGLINADDWYEKDCVDMVVAAIGRHDIAYGDVQYWKNGKTIFIQEGKHRLLKNEMTVNHPTVFVRRGCYVHLGNFNLKFRCAMDYDLLVRFHVNGKTFVHVPHVLANMRWEGISDRLWKQGCKETLWIKNRYFPDKRLKNKLYYYKHLLAIGLPKKFEKLHLGFITRFYRSRFSSLNKRFEK